MSVWPNSYHSFAWWSWSGLSIVKKLHDWYSYACVHVHVFSILTLNLSCIQFIEEAERSLHDAIMIVRRAMKNSTVVAGGGAIDVWFCNTLFNIGGYFKDILVIQNVVFCWQMEISRYLRQHARTIAGKSQLFINSYAKALEVCLLGHLCFISNEKKKIVWLVGHGGWKS